MPLRRPQLSFGKKVLLLAIALVTILQLGTLVPVLGTVRQDTEDAADRSVRLAGIVFDEYMRSRVAQLKTTVDVLAADFPFRNAVASRDRPTIESALANHAARAGTDTAVVYDLEGDVIASTGVASDVSVSPARSRVPSDDDRADSIDGVTFLDGLPYLTITVPVRAPVTIAWVMLGFPIDADFVAGIARLTELEVSVVSFDLDGVTAYASTLPAAEVAPAFDEVTLGDVTLASSAGTGHPFITELRPFLESAGGLYAALQLPRRSVVASYERIRNALVIVTVLALLMAILGAVWISRMVSRPVRELADAARRMREGIYNEPINSNATDEFGDLAAGFNAMQEAIANRERDIFFIAHHDSQSGLPARDMIVSRLRESIAEQDRIAVVNIAIRRFHDIASSLGHGTADQVIRHAAELLRSIAGEDVLLGHLSQHEFVLAIPGADADRAGELIAVVREKLRAGIKLASANISLQITAGIALFPDHRRDAPELLRCAAIARTNTDGHVLGIGVYEPDQDEQAKRLVRIVGDLPDALRNRELEVVYQPRIEVETGNVAGAEALVRWNHPELGRLNPTEFVTAIERAGGIMHLTRYVLAEAATQCAIWQSQGIDVPMSINISVDDLEDEYLPYYLLELSSRRQLEPGRITLEVTESAIMHNIETSLSVITAMRELGFRLAIDDFGTGQASLIQLKRIPADELKIDKSFVQNLAHPHDEAIVRAAIELAHQFGLEAVAEGVESASSFERLRALGCEFAQGFHFTQPLAPEAFEAWLRQWQAREDADLVRMVGAGT